jgi:hypothetical protein
MTKANGRIAVIGFKGEITEIDWSTAITRKYIFAKRLNCWKRHTGKKEMAEYLVVRM